MVQGPGDVLEGPAHPTRKRGRDAAALRTTDVNSAVNQRALLEILTNVNHVFSSSMGALSMKMMCSSPEA